MVFFVINWRLTTKGSIVLKNVKFFVKKRHDILYQIHIAIMEALFTVCQRAKIAFEFESLKNKKNVKKNFFMIYKRNSIIREIIIIINYWQFHHQSLYYFLN